jgi:hypothetical protein
MHVIMTLFIVFFSLFAIFSEVFFWSSSPSSQNTKAPRNLDQKWKKKGEKQKDQIITQGDSQAFSDDAHRQFVVISIRFWLLFLVKHPKKTRGEETTTDTSLSLTVNVEKT